MNYPPLFLEYCTQLGTRFTSLRKSILFLLWQHDKPLKAYEILEQLRGVKLNVKPPTVYRVLDYFVNSGLVHKIESIQSYMLCHKPQQRLPLEILMVCDHCHEVQESYEEDLHHLITRLAVKNHFQPANNGIEIRGVCEKCQRCP